jgi:hypothetical protein
MDFIHRPRSKILKYHKLKFTRFRKLALLPSSGEWRGRREEQLLCLSGQTEEVFLSSPPPFTWDGSRASFRKVVNFNF